MGPYMYLAMYVLNNNLIYKMITNLLIVMTVWMKMNCNTRPWYVFVCVTPPPVHAFMFPSKYYQLFLSVILQFR